MVYLAKILSLCVDQQTSCIFTYSAGSSEYLYLFLLINHIMKSWCKVTVFVHATNLLKPFPPPTPHPPILSAIGMSDMIIFFCHTMLLVTIVTASQLYSIYQLSVLLVYMYLHNRFSLFLWYFPQQILKCFICSRGIRKDVMVDIQWMLPFLEEVFQRENKKNPYCWIFVWISVFDWSSIW